MLKKLIKSRKSIFFIFLYPTPNIILIIITETLILQEIVRFKKRDSMKILALIPARMGSSRFLVKSMIGHVYERVSQNKNLSLTAVSTCNE